MKTDTQVKSDVLAALQWEPTVDARELSIDVNNGIVRLSGPVSSYVEKWDAGRATQRVCGVRGLHSDIVVELPESSRRNDAEIASAVVDVLQWMHYLRRRNKLVASDCLTCPRWCGALALRFLSGWAFIPSPSKRI